MEVKKRVLASVFFTGIILFSSSAYSAVLINEILANGLSDPDYEWIELFNNGSSAVNLTGWSISETSSSNFTINDFIPGNGFIILAVDFNIFNLTYPNVNLSGIKIIDITTTNFNLNDAGGEARLYNSSGDLMDSVSYIQASGKTFENVSIGRYPDGSSKIFNISTLTPGAKNDNRLPSLNRWVSPSRNSTNISGVAAITVNITDDTTSINFTSIVFNDTNFPMSRNGDLWTFLWNTSLNTRKRYNITVFFNDSYGKSGSDRLLNILVNNSPNIFAFSPSSLNQVMTEGSSLSFSVNASDPDDSSLNFSWYVDGALSGANANFSYTPGLSDNGTHAINSTVKDSSSNHASISWIISVANLNAAPVMQGIQNRSVSKNTNLSFNISASDFDNDILAYSANHSGIAISKFNNSLATVSWRPTN
ncbi:lamin tail domain-containing protein, partial [Candidatus Woesearchaeota archaeon]|nr:lamin tail domain-containing protein [Candidatus Woesearchaeota archaeon]